MEVFEIIGLLIAGAAGLINYVQNRRRRELAEELPEEGDEEFFPFPEDVLMETDEALESVGQETVESIPMEGQDAPPLEEMTPQGRTRGQGPTRGDQWTELQEMVAARNQTSRGESANQRNDRPDDQLAGARQDAGSERLSSPDSSILSAPLVMSLSKKQSSSRLATKKRARQAIIDAEVFAPPISKRQKGPFTPLSRPV
jgi:hypothetical protein